MAPKHLIQSYSWLIYHKKAYFGALYWNISRIRAILALKSPKLPPKKKEISFFSQLIQFYTALNDLYCQICLIRWRWKLILFISIRILSSRSAKYWNLRRKITKMTPYVNKIVTLTLLIRFYIASNDLYGETSLVRWQGNSFKHMPIEILSSRNAKWWNLSHKITKMTP